MKISCFCKLNTYIQSRDCLLFSAVFNIVLCKFMFNSRLQLNYSLSIVATGKTVVGARVQGQNWKYTTGEF